MYWYSCADLWLVHERDPSPRRLSPFIQFWCKSPCMSLWPILGHLVAHYGPKRKTEKPIIDYMGAVFSYFEEKVNFNKVDIFCTCRVTNFGGWCFFRHFSLILMCTNFYYVFGCQKLTKKIFFRSDHGKVTGIDKLKKHICIICQFFKVVRL